MKIKTSNAIASTLLCFLAATFVTGCEKKNAGGVAAPGIEETKAIAEDGFIYGLPIVMNYAVMNEYAVDKSNPQFKAPFNQIKNEPRVFTYEDTAIVTPNSDTPYSFVWLDLRAEPMVLSVPAVEKKRYYSVMLWQYLQLWLHRKPRHGKRARELSRCWPRLEGRDAPGHQEGVFLDDSFRACRIPDSALQSC